MQFVKKTLYSIEPHARSRLADLDVHSARIHTLARSCVIAHEPWHSLDVEKYSRIWVLKIEDCIFDKTKQIERINVLTLAPDHAQKRTEQNYLYLGGCCNVYKNQIVN